MAVNFVFRDFSAFDEGFFTSDNPISYIGTGSPGGKAGGLASMYHVLRREINAGEFPGVEICIPRMVVILTDVFDAFMSQNDLYGIALSDEPDEQIAMAFQQAELPFEIPGILRRFISGIHSPLAVRSSGILEDAISEPFAGVYTTKMTPNNQPDTDTRFRKLVEAVKFVYASTFFREAKEYVKATRHRTEDEKMGVILQEVIGLAHDKRFYPDISGTARTFNYYATGQAKPEDGVVNLAVGLGKTIVDGGTSWIYSPSFPRKEAPFNSVEDMLRLTQTDFWAVNMGAPPDYDPLHENEFLVRPGLSVAEEDGSLKMSVSTYDAESDRLWMGLGGEGPRVVNFAPLLVAETVPLNKVIRRIMQVCEKAVGEAVEIEFAANVTCQPVRFGFLQVRPIAVAAMQISILPAEVAGEDVLVASDHVLGNGIQTSVRDILYVDYRHFDERTSFQVAGEIERMNRKLVAGSRGYLLIGYGRWGTTDPLAGIPVKWHQVSGVRAFVEAPVEKAFVEISQGSHFFHNISGFRVLYFSIFPGSRDRLDVEWISSQEAIESGRHVRHIRLSRDMVIKADGRTGKGVILR